MLEMIFVIVVLGIIVGGTFVQISSIYEDMIQKQYSSELQTEAKIVAEEIVARVSSSIKESLIATTALDGTGCVAISAITAANNEYILEWIGKSDEANIGLWDDALGDYKPGWSGFVDVSASDTNSISTKGSKLSNAETIISNLTGEATPLSSANPVAAIYFAASGTNANACSDFFGDYMTLSKIYRVKIGSQNPDANLTQVDKSFAGISEQYTLSHSAYAVAKSGTNLYLYSFRPWLGETASHANAKKYLLAKNVTGFGFKWDGGLFRINVCVSKTLNGFPIEVCKEKALF